MSAAPTALFDVERLRRRSVPTLGAPRREQTVVVLGSSQPLEDLRGDVRFDAGVAVLRRRGGGGAVLLRPDDCWVELWLPRARFPNDDVRAVACEVGGWWEVALRALGVTTSMHREALRDADQGAVGCFAGLGPGELTVSGRKLLGLSQWRCREGALVSAVLARRSPGELAAYLRDGSARVPALERATCLEEVAPALDGPRLARRFEREVRGRLADLVVSTAPFA